MTQIPRRACAGIACALLLSACGRSGSDPAPADPAASLAVSLARAEARPVERQVLASGPVSAWEDMQLGVELGGLRVSAVKVDVGQAVRKGQLLLELDHRLLDSDLRQAQAALGEAEAGVGLARVNLERGQALAQRQLISASALDELRAASVQAQAREATARAQRDGMQLRRDFAELRAPDDGVIAKRLVQPGQVVSAGTELLRLIRHGRLEWRAELAEDDLAQVHPGDPVVLGAGGQAVAGRVRAVSPGLDADTRTGTVYADLPAPGPLKAGMYLEGRIVTGTVRALLVPAASVVRRDGYAYVFTVDEQGVANRRRVRAGAARDGWIEVLEGLAPGDAVVDRGAGFLDEGDRVRVVPAERQP